MPTFPLTRKPATDSIREGQPANVVRQTQTSVGPGKRRRKTTLTVRPLSMRLDGLTEANRATFENWYRDTIGMGTLAFDMPHPFNEATISVRFDLSNGLEWAPFGRTEYSLTLNLERIG